MLNGAGNHAMSHRNDGRIRTVIGCSHESRRSVTASFEFVHLLSSSGLLWNRR